MGNEVSRPTGADDLSPQNSGVVQPSTPSTPTGGFSRRAQSFNVRSPSPSVARSAPSQRRTNSSGSLGGNPSGNPTTNPKKERTIQRMDKAIRRRVRGGITYNLKLLIRGAKGTGKTSLLQRLKGEPIPETHQSTPQLQSATINWSFRQNLEENVKCEVWDVVDRGFVPVAADGEGGEGSQNAAGGASSMPVEHGGLQSGGSLSAEASAAAAAAAAAMQNGTHSVAIVDASTVDVYHEAHGVIFLLDITRWDTLEYVKQQLDNVPVHIPTLVLGNFRDQGAQRKIFKEDIQDLLYGSTDRPQHQQWRRPMELLYFECSLLNCYGLKSLHQYFGIPFLQLKLATIRQQMRIVEGEFAHLKHDVQATISEQRYAEYVEHIRATGSDIRTGRRGSGNGSTPPASSRNSSVRLPNREGSSQGGDAKPADGEAVSHVAADDDVSVVGKENGAGTPPTNSVALPTTITVATEAKQQEQEIEVGRALDREDLPARSSSSVIQAAAPLMFEHKESVTSIPNDVVEDSVTRTEDKAAPPVERNGTASATANAISGRPRKASVEEVMHLEDFQVPKTRTSDLDHFYSEDESDEDVGGYDEDVVVAPVDGAMKTSLSGVYHKQRFLDSDSSDSDESETAGIQRKRKGKGPGKSSPRRTATKQASATGQQAPRPPTSSPHPPTSLSRPNQISRPGSPARQQPGSPAKDVHRDVSPKQRQSSASSGNVSPTPPVVPPTSPLTSPIRHSSPRNMSSTSTSAPQLEASSSSSQDESEVKQGLSSSEEPELTGTEDVSEPMGLDEHEDAKEITKHASTKNSDNMFSPSKDADGAVTPMPNETEEINGDASAAYDTESSILSDTRIQPDMAHEVVLIEADSDTHNDPEEVVRVPTFELAEKDGDVSPATGDEYGGLSATSDEFKTSLADGSDYSDEEGDGAPTQNEMPVAVEAVSQISSSPSPVHHRPEILMSDEGNEDDEGLSLTSLQASLPIPESSLSSVGVLSASVEAHSSVSSSQEGMGHFHKRNLDESGDLLSLSALQASLSMPSQDAVLLSPMHQSMDAPQGYGNGCGNKMETTALQLSDLQGSPVKSSSTVELGSDFTTIALNNDLEAFLDESDSDSENAPPSYAAPSWGAKPSTKQNQKDRRATVESSDDGNDEEVDQDRFANYNISKKSRSERRRQQKEDLRQLNAALDTAAVVNDPFAPSGGVAVTESSFGTSDVLEAIRKAQEEAMRMLPSAPAAADDDKDPSMSKRRHKHKHKEHKDKKREADNGKEKPLKKCSRKSGSSSRSKKRRPHLEDDLA